MILLVSGGVDSIAAWRLLDCPRGVFVDYGQPAVAREDTALAWAEMQEWAPSNPVIVRRRVDSLHVQGNGYVPYRNALLVMLAANWTGDPHVTLAQVAEWAPDKNPRFYRHLRALMDEMSASKSNDIDRRHRIDAPFASITKGELLKLYGDRFGHVELARLLVNTWSCYGHGTWHCGECSGCVHRHVAERAAGVLATPYLRAPSPAKFYRDRANVVDAARWLRSGGFGAAIRRARELRRVLSTDNAHA